MKYGLKELTQDFEKGNKLKYLFFWGHQKSKRGDITASCFSQWWTAPFIIDSIQYPTAEHWMMAQKALLFNDDDIFQKILQAKSPTKAKQLGRKVKLFDDKIWNEKRFEIVVKGNFEKFNQHQDLKDFLINTKNRILVEASHVDSIWGIGLSADDEKVNNPKLWKGLNLLGFALMEVRYLLQNDQ